MRPAFRKALLAVPSLVLALAACGPDDALQGLRTPDAGTSPDAGTKRDLSVISRTSTDPRRGPIVLSFDFDDPDGDVGTGHLVEFDDGSGTFREANVKALAETRTGASYLWSSFADVAENKRVSLRITVRDPGGDVVLPFEVDVRNAPDTDRTVVIAHEASEIPGGGATDKGTEVSVLVWKGPEGGFAGAPRRITVGEGPRKVRAAPHGRAMAVLEQHAGTVSILATPLEPDASAVARTQTLAPPDGFAADVHWSRDGRFLFVLAQKSGNATDPTIWKWTPSEDLSSFDSKELVTTLPGPPLRFDVAVNGDFVVFCGSGGVGKSKVVRLDATGRELGRVEDDYGPPNTVAISPAGNLALMTSDLFGDDLRLFHLNGAGFTQVGAPVTTVRVPDEIVFHPGSTADRAIALVANADRNTVTPLVVTPAGITPGTPVGGLPLATDMDLVERGATTGTVLVSTVTTISSVSLSADGTVVTHGKAWDFGDGVTNLTYGIGIQR